MVQLTLQPFQMTETEWELLDQLDRGTLRWSPLVGDCWRDLVNLGYVKPNFGPITESGRAALQDWRKSLKRK